MYDELYAAWRFELENSVLGSLSSDFYARAADYLRSITEEIRMMDEKTVTSTLLERELEHTKCMVQELIWVRYKKLVSLLTEGQKLPSSLMADEEESLCASFVSFTESYQKLADKLLRGQVPSQGSKARAEKVHKRVALRFTKGVPAVIGFDMKTYGPFMVEDVGSVPLENADILAKQGLAKKVALP